MSNMFAFVKVLPGFQPGGGGKRKAALALLVVSVGIVAFFGGHWLGATQTSPSSRDARDPSGRNMILPTAGYESGVVAYLKGNIPITRQELGEYLIARMGVDRVKALVDRRIIEEACREREIYATNAEVEQQFQSDMSVLGSTKISERDFAVHILQKFNKTIFEWKEDYLRQRILMTKLVRPEVTVDPDDVQKAYDTKYGPKVECRMIVMKDRALWEKVYQEVLASPRAFEEAARNQKYQFIDVLRDNGGKVPAIHMHFGEKQIEQAAFEMREGQVCRPIEMPDGTAVIICCDKHIPAPEPRPTLAEVRNSLYRDVLQFKIGQAIPLKMQQLRQEWAPTFILGKQRYQNEDQFVSAMPPPPLPELNAKPPELLPPPPGSLDVKPPSALSTLTQPTSTPRPISLTAPPTDALKLAPGSTGPSQTMPQGPLNPFGHLPEFGAPPSTPSILELPGGGFSTRPAAPEQHK